MAGSVRLGFVKLRAAAAPIAPKQVRLAFVNLRTGTTGAVSGHQVRLSYVALYSALVPKKAKLSSVILHAPGANRSVRLAYVSLVMATPSTPALHYRAGGAWRPARIYRRVNGTWVLVVDIVSTST